MTFKYENHFNTLG